MSEPASEHPGGPFLYFAYGSNLDIARLRRDRWRPRLVAPARLDGYRLAFTRESQSWRGGVADIRPDAESHVWGALWVLPAIASPGLDDQEGVAAGYYERLSVEVTTAAGDRVRCRTYRVVAPRAEHVPPSPAYLETILRGARATGLPGAYLATLERIETNGIEGGGPAHRPPADGRR